MCFWRTISLGGTILLNYVPKLDKSYPWSTIQAILQQCQSSDPKTAVHQSSSTILRVRGTSLVPLPAGGYQPIGGSTKICAQANLMTVGLGLWRNDEYCKCTELAWKKTVPKAHTSVLRLYMGYATSLRISLSYSLPRTPAGYWDLTLCFAHSL